MLIGVIDGLGGGLGNQIITEIRRVLGDKKDIEIIALGTNAAATANLLKAGADRGATGENAIKVMSKKMDIIIGPIGIMIPDSMLGEITSGMVSAIVESEAEKILLPVQQSHVYLVGIRSIPLKEIIHEGVEKLKNLIELAG